jgi:hypothetical protein
MARMTCDIHCRLKHDNCEWDAWDPADETEDSEGRENGEHNPCTPQMFVEVVDRRSDRETDVQNPCDPDELFGEVLRGQEVCP